MHSLLLAAILVCTTVTPAASEEFLYSYVDESGVRHYTNAPVDERYRVFRPLHSVTQLESQQYDLYIKTAARKYNVDPMLVKAVIFVESDFDRYAESHKGAKGLMQLMPEAAQDMEVSAVYDPLDNIQGGTRYLRKMLDMFDEDLELSLAAYNAGPERVKKLGRIPNIRETQNYVKRVLKKYGQYKTYGSSYYGD